MESLIYFGGSVKALDESGRVGGYLVRFSDNGEQKDLSGEYFTSKTYLGANEGNGVDTIFHHGQPIPVKSNLTKAARKEIELLTEHVFAPIKATRDAIGIWAETVLNMADEYEKAVFGMIKNGKLGWSSGAVGHLVKKSDDGQILRWPIGEASLTPTPCEPLNRAITVKSLDAVKFADLGEEDDEPETIPNKPTGLAAKLNQHIDDLSDDKGRTREAIVKSLASEAGMNFEEVEALLSGNGEATDARLKAFSRVLSVSFDSLKATLRKDHLLTIKGMFAEALADKVPSRWELESIYCSVIKKLANAASAATIAGVKFDLEAKLSEATAEYTALLQQHALAQIQEWIADGADDDFYLKTITKPSKDVLADVQIDLSDHSDLLVNGLKSVYARFRGNHKKRVAQKAGRVLSEKNRQRIADLMAAMKSVLDDFQSLLDESQPMASESAKRAALTQTLRNKWRSRQLGVTLNG